jgi:RTX calcium-binding nonapeptide repeat (4 copies)
MAIFNITTNVTTQQNMATGDLLYVAAGASVFTTGAAIFTGSNTNNDCTVVIDGTVTALFPSATVLLNGTTTAGAASGIGSYLLTVGTTGVVRSLGNGPGLFTGGTGNVTVNNGVVDAVTTGIINNGALFTLLNTGLITARAIGVNVVGGGAKVTNTGEIAALTGAALDMFGDASLIQNAGRLSGATGIDVDGNSNTVVNTGQITGVTGVTLVGDFNSFANATGATIAATAAGLVLDGGGITQVTNAGSLTGVQIGISVGSVTTVLTNHGLIEGAGSIAIQLTNTATALTLLNTGTIRAGAGVAIAVEGNTGVEAITNSGTMIGGLALGDGTDVVTNTGVIRGNVDMGAGADRVTAVEGRIFGSILGGGGNDTVVGGAQADTVLGGTENDLLLGGAGDDDLQGGAGLDRIIGGLGNDRITAGVGADVLSGGLGADVFVFTSKATLGIGVGRDQITDFQHGVDDLNMAFMNSFIGSAAFTAAGQVRYVQATGVLSGSTDGDVAAEWALLLASKPVITAGDFVF